MLMVAKPAGAPTMAHDFVAYHFLIHLVRFQFLLTFFN